MANDEQKQKAGEAAAALVEAGMTVGLGTGTTAAHFVRALAARRLDVRGVSTSEATEALAPLRGLVARRAQDPSAPAVAVRPSSRQAANTPPP